MVTLLLQINPSVARITTNKIKLPLHFAASEGHVDICQNLLAVYPDGASIKSDKGKLPLHLATRSGSIETVSLLSAIYPKGLYLLDWESSPPLHIALREEQENVATRLIRQCPEALCLKNITGELPLDIALRNSPFHIVNDMVIAWPEGGRYVLQNVGQNENVDEWDWNKIELCLQAASGNFGREQCCCKNLNNNVKDFSVEDGLSILCEEDTELRAVEGKCAICEPTSSFNSELSTAFVIENYSFTLADIAHITSSKQINEEYLPLHSVLEITSSYSLIKRVLEMHPDQIDKEDKFKRLPLHVMSTHCVGGTVDIAASILRRYPEAVSHRDVFGRLPLHVALSNKAETQLVLSLIDEYPASAVEHCMTKDKKFSSIFPLFMATEYDCDLDVIFTLLRKMPILL